MNSFTSFITAKILFTIIIISMFFVPIVKVQAIDCSDMVNVNNSILSAQVFDMRNDLKEELMNLRHRSQIPFQFNNMSKHEYRFFLRGQIYAYACFLDMIEFQNIQTMYSD